MDLPGTVSETILHQLFAKNELRSLPASSASTLKVDFRTMDMQRTFQSGSEDSSADSHSEGRALDRRDSIARYQGKHREWPAYSQNELPWSRLKENSL